MSCTNSPNENQNNAADFEKQLQEKLINAKRGDVIEIPEGNFEITRTLSLVGIPNITIKGAGQNKSILSFKNQTEGAEGLKISETGKITIENLAIHDTKGDAIKINDTKGIIEFVRAKSKRIKIDSTDYRWPFAIMAMLLFLTEIGIRRYRENIQK